MFAWETLGPKAFKGLLKNDLFTPTKVLAANQGLYNGFLAAGLVWSFFINDIVWVENIRIFFLSCITIAGMYGGFSGSIKIFYIQGIPAILVLLLLVFN